jgi:hypothetical protein
VKLSNREPERRDYFSVLYMPYACIGAAKIIKIVTSDE